MKTFWIKLLALAAVLFTVSCQRDFSEKHASGSGPLIPFDFDWNMTRDVTLSVGMPVVGEAAPAFALINVYASPVLTEANLISHGAVDASHPTFRSVFTLPRSTENLYVQTVAPDGSCVTRMVPVATLQLDVPGARMAGAATAEQRALRAELVTTGGVLAVSSIDIPVVESVPTAFDRRIESTPKHKLYIGGTTGMSSYLIPAGVTITNNIDMAGWINGLPTLYVAGRLEMDALTVEKTRLVILDGGEVVLRNKLTINNSFYDKASVYVMSGATLSTGSLTFASATGGLLLNEGALSVTGGDIAMSAGKIYTTSGINASAKYEKIELRMSRGAEVHSDGEFFIRNANIDDSSVLANYENGQMEFQTLSMDNSLLDQRGILKAEIVKFSSRVTVNNSCRIEAGKFSADASSVIDLASGAIFVVSESAKIHSSTFNMAAQSLCDIHSMAESSYQAVFAGPTAEEATDGALAVVRIAEADKVNKWSAHRISGLLEVVCDAEDTFACSGGATIVPEQTVDIQATVCNGGEGSIAPNPVEPPAEEFEVEGAVYSYCFEDGWPWFGDYDMNDLVAVVRVDRDMNVDKVAAIRINWEVRASGADNTIAFAVALNRVSAAGIASVTSTHALGEGAFAVENGLEPGNSTTVIPFFNSVREVLGSTDRYINTQVGVPPVAVQKHTTTITFTAPVGQEVVTEESLDFFLVATRSDATEPERWREIHLPTGLPTTYANVQGLYSIIPDMPYKYYARSQADDLSNNGLMWGLRIPGEFAYPAEMNDIRDVYTEFMLWAQSGGQLYPMWYDGSVVSDKIYH